MQANDLSIKKVTRKECQALYRIRNHATVRKNLINNKPLDYQKHVNWFNNIFLIDKTHVHFLVKYKNKYIGLVLLRKITNKDAEIGIMFKETKKIHWPIIYSTVFILNYGFNNLKLNKLYSYVFPENTQAIKFNNGFSGKRTKSEREPAYKYIFYKNAVNKNTVYKRISSTFLDLGCFDLC